ncbi:MAG: FAD-dependent thymidylate synthase [Cyanobacteria bacterium J06638_20]
MIDSLFRVEVLSRASYPQQLIYAAAHQDYSEGFVFDEVAANGGWDESEAGRRVVKNLLNGGRGHFGPLEHAQIVLNVGWFPHSTMQQIRTHRVGVSFDVQSFRYTGSRIAQLGNMRSSTISEIAASDEYCEEVFYLRPVGSYSDREGKKYEYTKDEREMDRRYCKQAARNYAAKIGKGFSEEHARGLIPFDVRQHWVVSANVRSLMHLLDLRWKADAQLEAQQLCELIWPHFQAWVPEIAAWYEQNRAKKAKLAP